MSLRHSTLGDRYLRALPMIGLYFLWGQANKHITQARLDDQAFVATMQSMEADYPRHLATNNLLLQTILISASLLFIVLAWWISYSIFSDYHFLIASFCALCNAIWLDYLISEIVMKIFNRIRTNKTN